MSGFAEWIGAQADDGNFAEEALKAELTDAAPAERRAAERPGSGEVTPPDLPAHNFPAAPAQDVAQEQDVALELDEAVALDQAQAQEQETALDRNPDLWLYRDRTVSLLRRYVRLALETGRMPSIFGRELFRAKVTSYTATTFEDRVIFVHDVEKCLERLDPFDRQMISRVLLQEYDHERAARLLHCDRKTIARRMPELLDELSEEFLRLGLLDPLAGSAMGKPC